MGRVYRAKHLMMGRTVALKILSTSHSKSGTRVARFRREMQIVGMLDHPNIVRAFDADQVGGMLFIVMEYIPGVTLDSLLEARGKLPVAEVLWYGSQAAEGLEHAHKQGVVHRDVKPSNLLLSRTRQLKLLDLGLGVLLEKDSKDDFKTEAGTTVGTMDYLSPEQACMKKVDGRSDVYSLGCALFHLMSGRLPFEGSSSMERIAFRLTGQAVPIAEVMPGLPSPVSRVLDRMLAREPEDRFQTAGEAAAALAAMVRVKGQATASAAPVSPAASPAAPPKPSPPTAPAPIPVPPPAVAAAVPAPPVLRRPDLSKVRSKVRGLVTTRGRAIALAAGAAGLGIAAVVVLSRGGGDREDAPAPIPELVAFPAAHPAGPAPRPVAAPSASDLAEAGRWREAASALESELASNPGDLSRVHRSRSPW